MPAEPASKKPRKFKHRCSVCNHPERLRIEALRLGGVSLDNMSKTFGVGRDAIWRHMRDHVTADRKAQLLADVSLKDLAERAAAEGISLLDYLAIVRSTVIDQMLGAAACNDRSGTAALAGRATEVLREVGKLTGEMLRTSQVTNITQNTAVFMSSPLFVDLEQMLLQRLAPHPEALRAVVDGLAELQRRGAPPMLTAPGVIEHAA